MKESVKIQTSGLYGKFGKSNLDLNKLEEKLDAALESETPESLMGWLLKERAKSRKSVIDENNNAGNNLMRMILEERIIKSDSARDYWLNEFKPLFYEAFSIYHSSGTFTLNPEKHFEEWFKTILNK